MRPPRLDQFRAAFLILTACLFLGAALVDLRGRVLDWDPQNLGDDPVTNWERRVEPLKADLPKDGKIGYLSDWDLPNWNGSQSDMDNEYRLTQYALAPRLIVRGANYAIVIVNTTDPEKIRQLEAIYPIRQLHEYGFGLYLFAGQAE